MLFIISPAKALDFSEIRNEEYTVPAFTDRADKLAQKLKKKSAGSIKKMFQVSEDLAQLNYDRFQNWDTEKVSEFGKNALYAFNGHVYQKIDADTLSNSDLEYANKHLRILSGMYGILKPTDMILPHRLEMGTSWPVTKKNLYGYWSKYVTKELNNTLKQLESDTLINLASNEYFKVVDKKLINAKIINIVFKEHRENGHYATVSIFAKQARGSMCRFAFKNKIKSPEELKAFDSDGYIFNWEMSDNRQFVFTRG